MNDANASPRPSPDDRASVVATGVENELRVNTLIDVAQALANESVNEDEETARLLLAEAHVYGQWANVWHKQPQPAGAPPYPNLEPEYVPDSARDYLSRRAGETRRADLRARLLDIMWLRWRDHLDARGAYADYLALAQAADLNDAGASVASTEWLIRAAQLSMQLNHERAAAATIVRAEIRRGLPLSLGHTTFTIVGTLRLLETDPDGARELAADLDTAADAAGAARDRVREQALLDSCVGMRRAIGDQEAADAALTKKAASLEAQASEVGGGPNAGASLAFLSDAAQIYRDLGHVEDAQRLKRPLMEAGRETLAHMGSISASAEIDLTRMEAEASALRAWNDEHPAALLWLPFEFGVWPRWAAMEALKATLAQDAPLAFRLSRRRFDADARHQPEPTDPAERERAQVENVAARKILLLCGLLPVKIALLRRQGRWTVDRVVAALFVGDPQVADGVRGGLIAFEAADFWTSLHVLLPQVERLVRVIGIEAGAIVQAYTQGGGLRWSDLDELLSEPRVRAVASEDMASEMKALFTSPHGPNLRNNLAHGAIDQRDASEAACVATLMALLALTLRLAVVRSQAEQPAQPNGAHEEASRGDTSTGTVAKDTTEIRGQSVSQASDPPGK